ncbi:GcvT family protein [Nocardioides marmoribigeumensis]|uniref:4-methylaminobutanoate oxidase (Formaldehyde-forming) n=1 Tax=Nocardioides marmoribigeumensis TaxID=433649 RepID=A0ABU2BW50_9ACTN|nr:FAD-dependent oxidoreductase [Nocardioides marmoribigeumensis]MDR7362857.1 4-methylaminobutanoate oxidase (formaldehyde-forming) [Nocardioides marmoribigeumensis]
MTPPALPSRARVVVIGGGVIGCSIAYHLAHAGWTDVLVLERDRLTSGTTWHAAGLMTCFGSTSETSTGIRLHSRDLYARLEAETGQSTGFKPVGLIEAAADTDRLEEYRRVAAFQRHLGLEVEEISPREMSELFPWARTDDLLAGFHVPGDGRVNPVDVTTALAKGARQLGVRVVEGVRVEEVLVSTSSTTERVTGVRTSTGETVEAEYVVNCAGMWARELGAQNGLVIPNQAAEHYYLITDTIDGMDPDAPIFEDPASYGYYREEGGGMMVGLFEPRASPWKVEGIPRDFSFGTLPPDWDRMAPFLEKAMARVPVTLEVGVRTFFCGPESFTPDLSPAVGEAPGIRGYFVAAGMNSVGILSAGGLGRVLAHWIVEGRPDVDVTGFDVARFRPWQADDAYRAARTTEILGTVYAAHTPGKQLTSARDQLLSPVHDRLVEQGGLMREVSGWEGADWFAGPGEHPDPQPTWGRAPWFEQWEAEHRAVREAVGLMDMSFMAKLRVRGEGAGRVLDHLSAGPVDGPTETITYTQWLNEGGRIEADLTVTKLADDDFLVVASDTAHGHVLAWLGRHLTDGVTVTDVTTDYGQLNVQGPRSREVLATLTDADLSTESFPFRTARWVTLAHVEVLLVRITYLGELGYELYVPAGHAVGVYDAVAAAGAAYGLRPVGLKALASLRMEKAYRDFGHDIDNTDCPLEVGLGFALDLDKPFLGRDAVLARKSADGERGGMRQRLVQLRLTDPEPLLFHAEVVHRDGEAVGYVRAASYGWTLGGAVGLAFVSHGDEPVTPEWLRTGTWEVDVAGTCHPAEVSLRPMYDPAGERIKV